MSEQDPTPRPPIIIPYATPPASKKPLPLWARISIIILCAIAGLIVLAAILPELDGLGAMVGLGVCLYYLCVVPLLKLRRERAESDDEHERQWQEYEHQKAVLVAQSKRIYARGPLGSWRSHSGRHLVLESSGRGYYRWAGPGGPGILTPFEHKFDPERGLLVRISSPPCEHWTSVRFGFAAYRDGVLPSLYLWLASTNPLPPDLKDFWPFWGELERSPD